MQEVGSAADELGAHLGHAAWKRDRAQGMQPAVDGLGGQGALLDMSAELSLDLLVDDAEVAVE